MKCPFLEEITMVYCRAYPVKKLIPRHMVTTDSPCVTKGYRACPFYEEIMAGREEASRKAESVFQEARHREEV